MANALGGVGTNPADVLKVRLQMQNELGAAAGRQATGLGAAGAAAAATPPQQLGLLQMLKKIASVVRELSYSAIRMGLYDEVKELLAGHGDDRYSFPLWKKIVAGGISGCIGAAVASPTDLVKIRAQAMNPATGRPFYTYPSPWSALGTIYRTEGGIAGMYWGVVPTVQRAIVLTATQFATYDEVKYLLLGQGLLQEGMAAHIVSSITAGLAVATTTNPLDLVKSRYMNQEFDKVSGLHVCAGGDIYEGRTHITFISFEALRKAAGLEAV
ncbi:mitochondrial carrier domain-containing protein [Scenedesmus sp. NREL 46B-D3]|nr:mitochondrial carrier domain-containing protein [Scenedesmus sp. NREL 46B-D3]